MKLKCGFKYEKYKYGLNYWLFFWGGDLNSFCYDNCSIVFVGEVDIFLVKFIW